MNGAARDVTADDGTSLWMESTGRGPGVVLCHGGPGLWDYLAPVAPLVGGPARAHRYDQRGCGRSGGAAGPFTIDQFVADLDAVIDAAGDGSIVLGGHSWGATLALLYALRHPERVVGLLYLNGTGLEWPRWKERYRAERRRRLAPWLARHRELTSRPQLTAAEEQELVALEWSTDYADPHDGLRHATEMLASGFPINRLCSRALNEELDALDPQRLECECASLAIPVLVVEGARDPRPSESLDSLTRALRSVDRVRLDNAGHYPWVEAPGALGRAISEWRGSLA